MASLEELQQELKNLEEQLANPEIFSDYKKVAELSKKQAELSRQIENRRSGGGSNWSEAIVEIRAGTGGDEAAIFASNLFEMYEKYADNQKWDFKVIDSNKTSIGGYKTVTFEISGKDAFEKMRYESGVHRVQRVPATEKSGRVHTSTATVAVLH